MKKKIVKEQLTPKQQIEEIRRKINFSIHPESQETLKEEFDKLHEEIQKARTYEIPSRGKIFGQPGKPLGICSKCKKSFQLDQMQKYYLDPQTCYWLCPKCVFKKRMREKFNPRL